jgi:hypothetical protein
MRPSKPTNGNRLEVNGFGELVTMVIAIKEFNLENKFVQQSDYVFTWEKDISIDLKRDHLFFRLKKMIIKILLFFKLLKIVKLFLSTIKHYSCARFERYYFNKNTPR